MAHFTLTLYRNNQSESTKINLHSTDEWITYTYQSKKAFKFIQMLPTKFRFIWPSGFREENNLPIGLQFPCVTVMLSTEASSKALGQMNPNLAGSIYGRSSIKIAHFVLKQNDR
jgi:hypothetical protein